MLPAKSGTTSSKPSFPYEFTSWLWLDMLVSYISSPHFIGHFQYIFYLHFADQYDVHHPRINVSIIVPIVVEQDMLPHTMSSHYRTGAAFTGVKFLPLIYSLRLTAEHPLERLIRGLHGFTVLRMSTSTCFAYHFIAAVDNAFGV